MIGRFALLSLLLALGACSKSEGEACGADECGAGMACLNGKCKKCDGSDRCKSYGMCAAVAGECAVAATSDETCKQTHGSEKYSPCLQDGRCKAQGGACVGSNEGCQQSKGCKENGACTFEAGKCRPSGDSCHKSRVCLELAHCTVKDGLCALTSTEDCKKSTACKAKGLCTLREKSCIVASNADCAQSSMCKAHGNCTFRGGTCQP